MAGMAFQHLQGAPRRPFFVALPEIIRFAGVSSREAAAKVRSLVVYNNLWKFHSKEQWCEML